MIVASRSAVEGYWEVANFEWVKNQGETDMTK